VAHEDDPTIVMARDASAAGGHRTTAQLYRLRQLS